jgi:hypothetical protein
MDEPSAHHATALRPARLGVNDLMQITHNRENRAKPLLFPLIEECFGIDYDQLEHDIALAIEQAKARKDKHSDNQ